MFSADIAATSTQSMDAVRAHVCLDEDVMAGLGFCLQVRYLFLSLLAKCLSYLGHILYSNPRGQRMHGQGSL